jgi:hypothetical protein
MMDTSDETIVAPVLTVDVQRDVVIDEEGAFELLSIVFQLENGLVLALPIDRRTAFKLAEGIADLLLGSIERSD